jgi:hypothetical protein
LGDNLVKGYITGSAKGERASIRSDAVALEGLPIMEMVVYGIQGKLDSGVRTGEYAVEVGGVNSNTTGYVSALFLNSGNEVLTVMSDLVIASKLVPVPDVELHT